MRSYGVKRVTSGKEAFVVCSCSNFTMRLIVLYLTMWSLCACKCKRYQSAIHQKGSNEPIFVVGANRPVAPCSEEERIRIGVQSYKNTYRVNEDSIAYGYTANVLYIDRDSVFSIDVGAGTEIEIGRCRFRIIKVYPTNYVDTIHDNIYLYDKVGIQALSFPKKCHCENSVLRKFDREKMDSTWEYRHFNW
jgi:hypothetical protein